MRDARRGIHHQKNLILSLSKDEAAAPAAGNYSARRQLRYCTPGNTQSISNSRLAAVSAVLPEGS
jgi:hypothetical protein